MTRGRAKGCAWCDRLAVCEIAVQPAQYQTTSRVDALSGEPITARRLVRPAILVAACEVHRDITIGQPRAVVHPRHRSVRGPQLDLFASGEQERLRHAISGDLGR